MCFRSLIILDITAEFLSLIYIQYMILSTWWPKNIRKHLFCDGVSWEVQSSVSPNVGAPCPPPVSLQPPSEPRAGTSKYARAATEQSGPARPRLVISPAAARTGAGANRRNVPTRRRGEGKHPDRPPAGPSSQVASALISSPVWCDFTATVVWFESWSVSVSASHPWCVVCVTCWCGGSLYSSTGCAGRTVQGVTVQTGDQPGTGRCTLYQTRTSPGWKPTVRAQPPLAPHRHHSLLASPFLLGDEASSGTEEPFPPTSLFWKDRLYEITQARSSFLCNEALNLVDFSDILQIIQLGENQISAAPWQR